MNIIPNIIEDTGRGERSMDIYSRLLVDRIIIVGDNLNDHNVNILIAQLLFLANDNKKDIQIYINLKEGCLSAGLAMYDTIKYIATKCDICTICIGQAASVGSLILAAGTKGKRMVLPNSRIMMHQPLGRVGGKSSDIQLQAIELNKRKQILIKAFSESTGKAIEKISGDIDRDYFMNAREAIAYGIIDSICGVSDSLVLPNEVSNKEDTSPIEQATELCAS